MGRTGRLFHHEWAGITPDIMTIAKGIGGGFPLGACLATERAADGMTLGTHGSTYGGNPLACAVGIAVMDAITAPGLPRPRQPHLRPVAAGARGPRRRPPGGFRGGARRGADARPPKCRVPRTADVVRAGYDARVLVVAAADNVVRLLPPLNLTEAEVDEGLRRLDAAAAAVEATAA